MDKEDLKLTLNSVYILRFILNENKNIEIKANN